MNSVIEAIMALNNDPPTVELSTLALSNSRIPRGTFKRDALRKNELDVQAVWEKERAFESNAGEEDECNDKFLVTFPFPYSNGHLHIGHAFSLTKAMFRAQFERHMGKNVLFPFAFHCTGMPIQAAANKLKSEISEFGCTPTFPEEDPEVRTKMEVEMQTVAKSKATNQLDKKSKGGKTKLVAKTGNGIVRQWNILSMMVPEDEIPKFVDPVHWLLYFPPIGVNHLKNIGAGVDWRRSFITTSINPFYDSFIRWQFNVLREKGKIMFGKRNNVYSILDKQVCADHDRSEGEGVGPQEYVLIKLKLLNPEHEEERHAKVLALMEMVEGKGVYFVPATLRPETMYGQTNCFILPSGEYGAYFIDATDEVFIMSARSARGLSCQVYKSANNQYFTNEFGKITCLETFTGNDLLGLPLKAPNATYEKIYTLPLLTISMGKGTGVVTSVPSDAPDDYIALKVLKDKPDFAAKFGITSDMVDPFDVVPIISIEGYGNASAKFMCEKLKVNSFNEKVKLAQAKDETYLKGYNIGVMTIGPHAGKRVYDAKPLIKQEMIDAGQAVLYFEPESRVISRTNDDCIVAATDQWYLSYGEESWCNSVKKHVFSGETFNAYDPIALSKYEYSIGWLREWACTRQFGLGTFLPWNTEWVIESLSDSTIYMAYYTIAHLLQGKNNMNGDASKNPNGITSDDLTDDVFNYIYRKGHMPTKCKISVDVLNECRKEFQYWYPIDLRTSAKDLIPNHLTMALYIHAAIWDDEPHLWPRGYYTNGHVQVDAEKMSKSKGNFLLMNETVNKYSADATRFACADAGDSLDDANFSRETADSAIISLSNEQMWIKDMLSTENLRTGRRSLYFIDKVLVNDTNRLIKATAASYSTMQFRQGLQLGWFEMLHARNEYRSWCHDSSVLMHKETVQKWIESLIVIICPICPHWSENIWKMTNRNGLAIKAPWPIAGEEDKLLTRKVDFLRDSLKHFRVQVSKEKKRWKVASILITDSFPQWKIDSLVWLQAMYENGFPLDLMQKLKAWTNILPDKKLIQLTMQFVSHMKKEVEDVGEIAMETTLPFDQKEVFIESKKYIQSQLNAKDIVILKLDDSNDNSFIPDRVKQNVIPGKAVLWLH